ncbi:MAG: nucleoside hydrolase [Lentisphaeria bacterium]|nr:nucleoside hydrolase [Lentisphaeria bacterium]
MIHIVFDTDMGNDIDDALALALLHTLERRGECRLAAVSVNKGNIYGAAYTDLVNRFYGCDDLPVGLLSDGPTPQEGRYVGEVVREQAELLPYNPEAREWPSSTHILRAALAGAPDTSVVYVSVGFSTALVELLASSADDISPLSGMDLVARKVRFVSLMAGNFDPAVTGRQRDNTEYNVVTDIPSARFAFENCPVPMVFSGWEVGRAILYPAASILQDYKWAPRHPIAVGYCKYMDMPYDRPTYDLTSALHAVQPEAGWFALSEPGRVVVQENGHTNFEACAEGNHRYLVLGPTPVQRIADFFVELCSDAPENAPRSRRCRK